MPWPTPQDYNEAIQNPTFCFADAELRGGTPELTSLGLPRPITGNFASVYRLRCDSQDWAVRCFWREYSDMPLRYAAISKHLASVRLPYTVGFEYLPNGIRVRGTWYPILKMEWVEGQLLNDYIERNLGNPAALGDLARRWLAMVQALDGTSSAHGDLQHGNVLVVKDQLKLVDYDGMYVPELSGRGSHEIGHQNYQHPRRTGDDFGPAIDRFSAWVIYVSLVAVRAEPGLWSRLGAGDECMLFRKSDFAHPQGSPALQLLRHHHDVTVRELSDQLRSHLDAEPTKIPALATAMRSAVTAGPIRRRKGPPVGALAGWHTVTPGAPRQPLLSAGASPAVALPSWLHDHFPVQVPVAVGFVRPAPTIPRACMAMSAVILVLLVLTGMSSTVGFPEMYIVLGLLIVNLAVVAVFFGMEPQVRKMRSIRRREAVQIGALDAIDRTIRSHEAARACSAARCDRIREAARRNRARLEARESAELDAAREESDSRARMHAACLHELDRGERDDLEQALKSVQEKHVRGHLARCSVRTAQLPGITWSAKARLWAAGIRSARDLTADRMRRLAWLGEAAVPTIVGWRVDMERDARRTMPRTLSTEEKSRISAPFATARHRLHGDRVRAEIAEQALAAAIRERYARRYRPIDDRLRQAEKEHTATCAEIERYIDDAVRPKALEEQRLAEIQRELEPFAAMRLGRYVLHLVVPRK